VDVLVNVCAMLEPDPAEVPVSNPELVETVQLKVVPATLLVKAIPVVPPEQNVCEAGVAVTTGFGFTVTTTVTGVPAQPAAVGVTV
jgi:hypothetical protein